MYNATYCCLLMSHQLTSSSVYVQVFYFSNVCFHSLCAHHKVWVWGDPIYVRFIQVRFLLHMAQMKVLLHHDRWYGWTDSYSVSDFTARGGTVLHCLKGQQRKQRSTKHLLIVIVIWEEDIMKLSSCKWVKRVERLIQKGAGWIPAGARQCFFFVNPSI